MLARAGSQLQKKSCVHHTQQISMAAVAGDAENIKKQARKIKRPLVLGPLGKERKKENTQPKGGMGERHAATTQGF